MNIPKTILFLIAYLLFSLIPVAMLANNAADNWTMEPWQTQEMIAWGNSQLVVDFGLNGLWKYDGSWVQLSRWNAESIVVRGEQNLTVNFGSNGLWNFDGLSWTKIALGHL